MVDRNWGSKLLREVRQLGPIEGVKLLKETIIGLSDEEALSIVEGKATLTESHGQIMVSYLDQWDRHRLIGEKENVWKN